MRKRTKILIAVISAVLLLSMVIGGIAVFADDTVVTTTPSTTVTSGTNGKQDAFLTALAAKLNVSVDQLKTAITEARKEVQAQQLQERLQKMVDDGKITQEQMNEYLQWWNSRPQLPSDVVPGLGMGKAMGRGGMMGKGFGFGRW